MNLAELFPYASFTDHAFAGLWPFIILAAGGTLALIAAPLFNGKNKSRSIALLTLVVSAVAVCLTPSSAISVGGVLELGGRTHLLLLALHLAGAFGIFLLSSEGEDGLLAESNALVIYAICGMGLLVCSQHLLFQFIAIEIMSLAVYVLVAMRRTHRSSAEAGMKYFILGGLASASFLYGSALIYGASGSFHLPAIAVSPDSLLKTAGFVLVVGGLLFKVGAVPFHGWVPDVYQGASLPVTGFMAAAVKLAAFIVLSAVASAGLKGESSQALSALLMLSAALTMCWGNFAALTQTGLKRLLAYSSIAHTGYLLLGVLAAGSNPQNAPVALYLLFYTFATFGAFASLQALAAGRDDLTIDGLAGRGLSHPLLGLGLTVFLFAMAGIPLTAGFIGKYLVFGAAVKSGHVPLVVLGVLTSVAAVYYYLRVVVALYMKPVSSESLKPALRWGALAVILICLLTTLYYGIMPAGLIGKMQAF